jgi:hypothetical protein
MTKRKANPQPHRFTPGHKTNVKPEGTQFVGIRIMVRPDQFTALDATGNRSKAVREAIDLLISTQVLAASSRDGQKEAGN